MGNTPKPKRSTTNNIAGKKVQTGKTVPIKKVPYSNQYGSWDGTKFKKVKGVK